MSLEEKKQLVYDEITKQHLSDTDFYTFCQNRSSGSINTWSIEELAHLIARFKGVDYPSLAPTAPLQEASCKCQWAIPSELSGASDLAVKVEV